MSSSPLHPTGTLTLSSAPPAALSRSPWERGDDEWNKQKVKASVAVTSSVCKHSPDPNRVLYPINILSTASLGEVRRTVNPVFRNKWVYDKPWVIVIPPLPLNLKLSTINLILNGLSALLFSVVCLCPDNNCCCITVYAGQKTPVWFSGWGTVLWEDWFGWSILQTLWSHSLLWFWIVFKWIWIITTMFILKWMYSVSPGTFKKMDFHQLWNQISGWNCQKELCLLWLHVVSEKHMISILPGLTMNCTAWISRMRGQGMYHVLAFASKSLFISKTLEMSFTRVWSNLWARCTVPPYLQ